MGVLSDLTALLPEIRRLWVPTLVWTGLFAQMAGVLWVVFYGATTATRAAAAFMHHLRTRHLPPELRSKNPDLSQHKTVGEVMQAMGIKPIKEITWPVGAAVRKLYEERYGIAPRKALRTKTSGTGTHDFAVYPPALVPDIEKIVRTHVEARRRASEDSELAEDRPPPIIRSDAAAGAPTQDMTA
jgi:hypothetical protein